MSDHFDINITAKVLHTLSNGDVFQLTVTGFPNADEASAFKDWLFGVIRAAQDDRVSGFRSLGRLQ